ncbi:PAS domain S-box protein [Methylocystis sp. MJC1]|uniref:HWE histidine kinase domain-containing protein n=1 Tax=Methylocystis sp. MJC1 TaxID=2654282 RepID=UPI001FEFAA04|nr:HWE histidine kinase domain-containing protein [Methylocystis sp. MJC1]KAF2990017.1 Blue-light-activated histidine kinase [Methylocystis sp. MJC1]UZX11664.1 PAS domain S-box protein [Methylocystis sp. MJC1]
MVEKDLVRILGFALPSNISLVTKSHNTLAAESRPLAQAELSSTLGQAAIVTLVIAFVAALVMLYRLDSARRRNTAATHRLAELAHRLKAGEAPAWTATGVTDIDDIARALDEFEQRLRRKRALLTRLNEELIRGYDAANEPSGFNNRLRAIIDALPVGVLIAEAPSGRILEGNSALEAIRRGPVIYSEGVDKYHHWAAVHESGEPVQEMEYPLARALAGEDRPTLECRHQRADGTWGWINIVGAPIRDAHGKILAAIVAITDIDEIKNAEEHRRIMNLELHHRVNNSLAMIQGVANITARTATDFASFRNSFSDRIQCLSRLSTLLVKKSWAETPMKELATTALAYDSLATRDRISMSGEEVELRSEVALALGMALHELLSNAEQHGALSTEEGCVMIDWRIGDDEGRWLRVNWKERGGPQVADPQHSGVGLYLMKTVLTRQFGGDINIAFEPDGLRATITAEV